MKRLTLLTLLTVLTGLTSCQFFNLRPRRTFNGYTPCAVGTCWSNDGPRCLCDRAGHGACFCQAPGGL